jgi:putative Holliday junction resolvase
MGRILGLDVGNVRIGIAQSDLGHRIASPHSVYKRVGYGPDTRHFENLAKELNARLLVLGLPKNMDGSEGFQAQTVRDFAQKLQEAGFEVVFVDERLTTVSAERALIEGNVRRDKRKENIDSVAAALILQQYLDGRGK